ncbi:MAG: hypothetical protein E7454_05700 [Ruminococcaceae bacterium]|nr:hypothetical protein [Oscillospiraceae bacterium]
MSKDILIKTGDLSSRLLKKTRDKLDTAANKLGSINCSLMYDSPTGYVSLYPSSVSSDVIRLKNSLDTIRERLRLYADILDAGPDAICEVDTKSKNDLTSWWDRATYEDGWLTKFFGNDLKTSGAVWVREGQAEGDFFGVGASTGYAANALYYDGKVKNSAKWDLDKGNIEASTKASIEAGLADISGEVSLGIASAESELAVGVLAAEATGKISIMREGQFDPSVEIGAKASAKGITGETETQLGTEDFNVHAKAEGVVGVAEAEAKAGFGEEEGIYAKAEVGAAVFQGEASAGFTLFGIRIDAAIEGEALSVGAEAEFNIQKNSFELGGKLSFLAGLGLKIKISW